MTQVAAHRRIFVALTAVAVAALLFRPQIGSALVTRGDEFLARGDAEGARTYYRRAMVVDRDSRVAVDRFVFSAAMSHQRALVHQAIGEASTFLSQHAPDATLLEDRALCYQLTGHFARAAADFAAAARMTGSARDFTFAGWAELRSGHRLRARRLWSDALLSNPSYGPARSALGKVPA